MMVESRSCISLLLCAVVTVSCLGAVVGHGAHDEPPTLHEDTEHEKAHVEEHYEGQLELDSNMTEEELQFHYFKIHDFNNDTSLDGLEIYYALTHHDPAGKEEEGQAKKNLSEIYQPHIDLIDQILETDDADKDGYITYQEYKKAGDRLQAEAEAKTATQEL